MNSILYTKYYQGKNIERGIMELNSSNIDNLLKWNHNREIYEQHVEKFLDLLKLDKFIFELREFNFVYKPKEKKYYIIDGQHRIEAIKRFLKESNTSVKINVCLYISNNNKEIKKLFMILNHYEPQNASVLSGDVNIRNCVESIIKYLKEKHKEAVFKDNNKTVRRPCVNVKKLDEDLTDIIIKYPINNIKFKNLYEKFISENINTNISKHEETDDYNILYANRCVFSCIKGSEYKHILKKILDLK